MRRRRRRGGVRRGRPPRCGSTAVMRPPRDDDVDVVADRRRRVPSHSRPACTTVSAGAGPVGRAGRGPCGRCAAGDVDQAQPGARQVQEGAASRADQEGWSAGSSVRGRSSPRGVPSGSTGSRQRAGLDDDGQPAAVGRPDGPGVVAVGEGGMRCDGVQAVRAGRGVDDPDEVVALAEALVEAVAVAQREVAAVGRPARPCRAARLRRAARRGRVRSPVARSRTTRPAGHVEAGEPRCRRATSAGMHPAARRRGRSPRRWRDRGGTRRGVRRGRRRTPGTGRRAPRRGRGDSRWAAARTTRSGRPPPDVCAIQRELRAAKATLPAVGRERGQMDAAHRAHPRPRRGRTA